MRIEQDSSYIRMFYTRSHTTPTIESEWTSHVPDDESKGPVWKIGMTLYLDKIEFHGKPEIWSPSPEIPEEKHAWWIRSYNKQPINYFIAEEMLETEIIKEYYDNNADEYYSRLYKTHDQLNEDMYGISDSRSDVRPTKTVHAKNDKIPIGVNNV